MAANSEPAAHKHWVEAEIAIWERSQRRVSLIDAMRAFARKSGGTQWWIIIRYGLGSGTP